jgi:norsolorinic acid ketoreductase
LIEVQLDPSDCDAADAILELQSIHGIEHLDTVIANAGITNWWGPTIEVPVQVLREHYHINTSGTLTLFHATWPLLEKSSDPKFVFISTTIGMAGNAEKPPFLGIAHGASNMAMNYITEKIHEDHPALTVFPIHPGFAIPALYLQSASLIICYRWIQTGSGHNETESYGKHEATATLKACLNGLVSKV